LEARREAVDLRSRDGAWRFGGAGCAALRNEREHDLQVVA
jgi:hypothetical protein